MEKRSRSMVRDACRQALNYLLGVWLLLSSPVGLYGQTGTPAHAASAWKAHLSGNISLDSLTSYLNRHSRYRLTFDAQKVKGSMIVSLRPGVYDLPRLLSKIRSATGLSTSFHADHIILRQGPPAARPSPTSPPLPTSRSLPASPPLPTVRARTASIVSVQLTAQQRADTPAAITATRPRTVKGMPQTNSPDQSIPAPTNPALSGYLQAGVSATEVLYLNVGVEAGFRVLHLLVSGGTSWHTQVWGIGLGSVVAGDDDHQYQVKVQFFPLKIGYALDSAGNSNKLTVKGQLLRGDLLWGKRFGDAWLLKIGPDVSLLRTHYYQQGAPVDPGNFTGATENADKQFYLLKPPDLLHNSFSRNSPANTKWWIGLSIGLFYDLPSRSR